MVKSVIKEIFITALLLAIIILTMSVLFYEYIPKNKIIAEVKTYTIPEKFQEELNVEVIKKDLEDIVFTYTVENSDLTKYEKAKNYVPGKVNPFAKADVVDTTTGNTTTGNTTTGTNTNTNSTSTSGEFYENENITSGK